jgi:hypothetical protein
VWIINHKILKEKNMKKYEFKTNGQVPKDCEHIVEYGYGCSLQMYLMWRLINTCDVVLDKKIFSDYCDELGEFIEKKHQLNQNGEEVISHYSSVDMEAELLMMFMYSKFGDKIYVY